MKIARANFPLFLILLKTKKKKKKKKKKKILYIYLLIFTVITIDAYEESSPLEFKTIQKKKTLSHKKKKIFKKQLKGIQ